MWVAVELGEKILRSSRGAMCEPVMMVDLWVLVGDKFRIVRIAPRILKSLTYPVRPFVLAVSQEPMQCVSSLYITGVEKQKKVLKLLLSAT